MKWSDGRTTSGFRRLAGGFGGPAGGMCLAARRSAMARLPRKRSSAAPSYPARVLAGVGAAALLGAAALTGCGLDESSGSSATKQPLNAPADAGVAPDAGEFLMGDVAAPDEGSGSLP